MVRRGRKDRRSDLIDGWAIDSRRASGIAAELTQRAAGSEPTMAKAYTPARAMAGNGGEGFVEADIEALLDVGQSSFRPGQRRAAWSAIIRENGTGSERTGGLRQRLLDSGGTTYKAELPRHPQIWAYRAGDALARATGDESMMM